MSRWTAVSTSRRRPSSLLRGPTCLSLDPAFTLRLTGQPDSGNLLPRPNRNRPSLCNFPRAPAAGKYGILRRLPALEPGRNAQFQAPPGGHRRQRASAIHAAGALYIQGCLLSASLHIRMARNQQDDGPGCTAITCAELWQNRPGNWRDAKTSRPTAASARTLHGADAGRVAHRQGHVP